MPETPLFAKRRRSARRSKGRQGTLAKRSGQAAIRQGLRLACKLADVPQKSASQTAQNGGPSAIRLFKSVILRESDTFTQHPLSKY